MIGAGVFALARRSATIPALSHPMPIVENVMRTTLILLGLLAAGLFLAACGDEPPPTQIYIVISPTPETQTATPTASPTVAATETAAVAPAPSATPAPSASPSPALPSPTPQPAGFPTNVAAEVQIAEQVFEHGRMFWIRHTRQIWVMVNVPQDNSTGGDWFCYNDTFEEGEAEIDESLVPPEGQFQPRRGFGKLWRTRDDLKNALGWAITPEFELTSSYTYIAGGTVQGGQYLPGPGEHRLTTLYHESISFFEADIRGDCQGGTWRMAAAP